MPIKSQKVQELYTPICSNHSKGDSCASVFVDLMNHYNHVAFDYRQTMLGNNKRKTGRDRQSRTEKSDTYRIGFKLKP